MYYKFIPEKYIQKGNILIFKLKQELYLHSLVKTPCWLVFLHLVRQDVDVKEYETIQLYTQLQHKVKEQCICFFLVNNQQKTT